MTVHSLLSPRLTRGRKKKVCRNTRCAFFFFVDYKFLSCDILRISLIYVFAISKYS